MINETITAALLLFASFQFVLIFGEISSTDTAQFDFAVDLIKEIAQNDESTISSPASISTALFMLYLAADGETKQKLSEILGRNARKTQIQEYYGKLLASSDGTKSKSYMLNIANRLYVPKEFSIKPSIPHIFQFYFGETLHRFNDGRSGQLIKGINRWASKNTNNRIVDLMETTKINSQKTKMLLLNTIHFEAVWRKPFFTDKTQNEMFQVSKSKKIMMPMMQLNAVLKYYEDKFVQVVKLPYVGDKVEMVIILPKARSGLYKVREEMTGRDLRRYIENAVPTKVELKLPKFELQQKLDLEDVLKKIGITYIFSKKANFNALSDNSVSINNIIHKTSFGVNEKGTESTKETGFNSPSFIFPYSTVFNANHPFLFFVIRKSQDVLFAGECCKKTNEHISFTNDSKNSLYQTLFLI
ncbi:Serpin (serine protease inhibitor) family protein [Brugia pahangi]